MNKDLYIEVICDSRTDYEDVVEDLTRRGWEYRGIFPSKIAPKTMKVHVFTKPVTRS